MKKIILLFALSLLSLVSFSQKDEWSLAKDKNGIKVYTKSAEEAKIKEFKAIATINASALAIEKELKNVEKHDQWIKDVLNPQILKKVNENEYYSYYELKIPFPFDNRDMILHVTCKTENEVINISQKTASTYISKKSGIVRMPISEGNWKLTPQGKGATVVHYQFLADPGGSIPSWITNMFIVDGPYSTLLNLKAILEK